MNWKTSTMISHLGPGHRCHFRRSVSDLLPARSLVSFHHHYHHLQAQLLSPLLVAGALSTRSQVSPYYHPHRLQRCLQPRLCLQLLLLLLPCLVLALLLPTAKSEEIRLKPEDKTKVLVKNKAWGKSGNSSTKTACGGLFKLVKLLCFCLLYIDSSTSLKQPTTQLTHFFADNISGKTISLFWKDLYQ